MEEIKVTIKQSGDVEIDCNGFIGAACDITKVAEEALGLVSRDDKGEAFKNELNLNEFDLNT